MTGYKHLKNKLIARYIKNLCIFVVVSFIRKKARGGHQSEETCFTQLILTLSRVSSRFGSDEILISTGEIIQKINIKSIKLL